MKLQILHKNNLLIQSNYNLNLVQNKIYLTILYQMQKDSRGDYICRLHLSDIQKLVKYQNQKTPKGIDGLLGSLMNKHIKLRKIKANTKYSKYYTCGIISAYEWDDETNEYMIKLDGMVYGLLIDYYELGHSYTPLNLAILLGLNNYYAQRIYELIRMENWKNKVVTVSLEDLKESLELVGKYAEYRDFKKRILIPSIQALNETERITVDYKENKVGRKVVSIDFIVEDLEPRKYIDVEQKVSAVVNASADTVKQQFKETIKEQTPKPTPVASVTDKTSDLNEFIDTSMLDRGFMLNFKRTYKNIDFSLEYIQDAYYQVIGIVLEKDNVEVIGMRQWKIFKMIFDEVVVKNEREDIENFLWDLDANYLEKYCQENS